MRRLAAGNQGRYLVGIVRRWPVDWRDGIGVAEPIESLRNVSGLDGWVSAPPQGVGNDWSRVPVARIHPGPGEVHLGLPGPDHRRGRQGRTFPDLIAELLPGRAPAAIQIGFEDRILAGGAEVPGVVGRVVAVQVNVPVLVQAGVACWLLQLLGRLGAGGESAGNPPEYRISIEVAVLDESGVGIDQPVFLAGGKLVRLTRGVAGGDGAAVPADQSADDDASPRRDPWRNRR